MPEHSRPVVYLAIRQHVTSKWRFGPVGLNRRKVRKDAGGTLLAFAPERLKANNLTRA